MGLWTSNRSRITTTRSFSCKLKSQINDDLYFTNLTQILKIHVDFRVISQHYLYNTSSISEVSELCAGPENRDNSSHFSWKTRGKRKIKIWEFNLILISGTAYFKGRSSNYPGPHFGPPPILNFEDFYVSHNNLMKISQSTRTHNVHIMSRWFRTGIRMFK